MGNAIQLYQVMNSSVSQGIRDSQDTNIMKSIQKSQLKTDNNSQTLQAQTSLENKHKVDSQSMTLLNVMTTQNQEDIKNTSASQLDLYHNQEKVNIQIPKHTKNKQSKGYMSSNQDCNSNTSYVTVKSHHSSAVNDIQPISEATPVDLMPLKQNPDQFSDILQETRPLIHQRIQHQIFQNQKYTFRQSVISSGNIEDAKQNLKDQCLKLNVSKEQQSENINISKISDNNQHYQLEQVREFLNNFNQEFDHIKNLDRSCYLGSNSNQNSPKSSQLLANYQKNSSLLFTGTSHQVADLDLDVRHLNVGSSVKLLDTPLGDEDESLMINENLQQDAHLISCKRLLSPKSQTAMDEFSKCSSNYQNQVRNKSKNSQKAGVMSGCSSVSQSVIFKKPSLLSPQTSQRGEDFKIWRERSRGSSSSRRNITYSRRQKNNENVNKSRDIDKQSDYGLRSQRQIEPIPKPSLKPDFKILSPRSSNLGMHSKNQSQDSLSVRSINIEINEKVNFEI